MGIFNNPSEVPIPGPPPRKETVRIELAGCGNLVKSLFCHPFDYLKSCLFSVAKLLGLLCCPVQNVMQVSGLLCQLQQKQLVDIMLKRFFSAGFLFSRMGLVCPLLLLLLWMLFSSFLCQ